METPLPSPVQAEKSNTPQLHIFPLRFYREKIKTINFWFHQYRPQTNEMFTNITENLGRFLLAISIFVNATCNSFPDTKTCWCRPTYPMNSWLTGTG